MNTGEYMGTELAGFFYVCAIVLNCRHRAVYVFYYVPAFGSHQAITQSHKARFLHQHSVNVLPCHMLLLLLV